jgi:8-amino-7-oxononanoate synthase
MRTVKGRLGPHMVVDGQPVLMLAGSNYLDLSGDARVVAAAEEAARAYGCAAGGSRLISGNLDLHEAFERELASFVGAGAALVFSTGYTANLGVIPALAGPEDVIISDELNHASIIDACRLSRSSTRLFHHNDPEDLARVAGGLSRFRRRILVLSGVYGMEGDVARLGELVPVARSHDMTVVLDDTHGLGVLGPTGRGTAECEGGVSVDIQIGNLGKALGSFGAYVAGSETLREFLVNRARSFIFTCGLAPGPIGAAREALRILQRESWRRERLLERAQQLRAGLREAGLDIGVSTTHIVPAIVGDEGAVMQLCEAALRKGVYAQGIRHPSVPRGAARIRFTPVCTHTPEEIETAVRVFAELIQPYPR